MLDAIDLKKSARLTDEEIKTVFSTVAPSADNRFLSYFATAVLAATRRDFMILRPTALILIAKYRLTQPTEGASDGNSIPENEASTAQARRSAT